VELVPDEVLAGGNLNPVARRGDTVRRAIGAWTPAVHLLLKHLEAHGFEAAPRVLGVDDQGREVLTFIEGDTDSSGAPSWIWSERALIEAACLIRCYHDLSRSFQPPANPHWQVMVGAPTHSEVICHNDLAPFNTVYREGIPVAFFDWDLAAPGPPLWDIAYAAWRFVPLYGDTAGRGWPAGIDERTARLRSFCDAYGLELHDRGRLVQMIERRIQCGLDTGEAWARAGKPGWSALWRESTHRDGVLRDLAYVKEHRRVLSHALV
jgi:Phosphotransferase enzyme family